MAITEFLKKYRIQLLFFVCIFIGLSILQSGETSNIQEAQSYLVTNAKVLEFVGTPEDVGLKKWWSYGESGSNPPHKEYLFYVRGNKKNALVTVGATEDTNKTYSIVLIKPIR